MLDTTTEAGARADRRLREEIMIWLTMVRADGQPQSVPVWFLWDGETFLIYSQPGRQKLKNIGRNARVGLHLNANDRGGDVVRVEGAAEVVQDIPPANEGGEYLEKYRESIARIGFDPDGFARAYSVALRVTPDRWRAW
ncbi:MAG: TIGR03667 family PPOX class F420-dependent oxidoreductase [Actinobacteria bacterium]|nr:TIGR03667 family PPOX class F420-dependent oxidoreductase [Actinomycetota bacterium]